MPTWYLFAAVALFWLSYPFFGAIAVAAGVANGSKPPDAGFSFLPELIVFPPIFIGIAFAIDAVAMPWGRWLVTLGSIGLFLVSLAGAIMNIVAIRRSSSDE